MTNSTNTFQISRDADANWVVTNTESGVVIGTFWSHEDALQRIAFVERRIAAHNVRKQALYIYA
jgi:hypothetical protein